MKTKKLSVEIVYNSYGKKLCKINISNPFFEI